MKKVLALIAVACMAFATTSQAQVKFGVQAGLNLTEMSLNKSEIEGAVKNNAGFFVGPTVKFTLPIVGLGVDAAALYDQRESELGDQKIKSQSIQVPINVRYGVGLGSLVNVFAFAGPQFGFNLGDKSFSNLSAATDQVKDWTLKSSNLSANVGVGATVLGHLQVKVNYNIALGKTGEFDYVKSTASAVTGAAESLVTGNLKSNAWQISAAYFF